MKQNQECFLTGEQASVKPHEKGYKVESPIAGHYTIDGPITSWYKDDPPEGHERLLAAVRRASEEGSPLHITEGNFQEIIDSIPERNPLEKVDEVLTLIYRRSPHAGIMVSLKPKTDYPLVAAANPDELNWLLRTACGLGYLNELTQDAAGWSVEIGIRGWQRLDELRRQGLDSTQAFVAMWFTDEVTPAWEKAIRPALIDTGWHPYRVDQDEHVDKIDDRIIAGIRRSGLVVADFTGHRGGVYYEAGFAQGLGISVIWTCHQDHVSDLHFDTRQYNHIVWTTPDDLREKLTLRLQALGLDLNQQ